ncbi:porin family protein [Aquimarina intermedia]|uniref:Outer membrane protein with beta-barrel domain n=1 Tax=Aquimarina intermedia TaxID=350814 RepID=A0A5S5CCI8_9FLAO|nr:porin family protein [Aquimarina intermedia]TYP76070.1 outer membrane protein with beta-barrel domain [Aquimarina intermedia]
MIKRIILIGICLLTTESIFGQQQTIESLPNDERVIDSLYREDQFYVGFTFNLLFNRPKGVSQSGFSGGLHLGYTRDMPINKRRNLAVGLGLGYSVNSFSQTLFIGEEEENEKTIFASLDDVSYDSNRFTTHLIESPLELRWRTSTAKSHKFYRVYTGLRLGYLFYFNSNFQQTDNSVSQTKIDELNRFRAGATFTFGWNTFNFHFYYSLNSLFDKNARIGEEPVGIEVAKIGLMFYIL